MSDLAVTLIAYWVVCCIAGIGVARHSGLIVGVCMGAAYIIGRTYG